MKSILVIKVTMTKVETNEISCSSSVIHSVNSVDMNSLERERCFLTFQAILRSLCKGIYKNITAHIRVLITEGYPIKKKVYVRGLEVQ